MPRMGAYSLGVNSIESLLPISEVVVMSSNPALNKRFCEQMGEALVNLGTTETLSCMARMMCAIAHNQSVELEFECDLGTVVITPKNLPQVH